MNLKVAMFCHSLVSDWNHGNAHFLRGIVQEMQARHFDVRVFEPQNAWSRENLQHDHGHAPLREFSRRFPTLSSIAYTNESEFESELDRTDLILAHEWNEPRVIAGLGAYRKRNPQTRLFFHDTHHRAITAPDELARFDLSNFDGVLAYGESLKHAYQRLGWGKQVYVWHEAADIRTFHPSSPNDKSGDLVWIGNWGDDERTEELREYFVEPCRELALRSAAFGVRYPEAAIGELHASGIRYRGWIANYKVPETFAEFRATIHVPRRPYTRQLPGIPTIRPFEALACGIPLVSAPWIDSEGLFRVGQDFLMAQNGAEMRAHLRDVLHDPGLAQSLIESGLDTIRSRHTCGHRVDELLNIYQQHQPAIRAEEVYS